MLKVEDLSGELYITSAHPMTKDNYISFVAYLNDSTEMFFKQYPEWQVQIYMPVFRQGILVWYSTDSGLMYQDIADIT